MPFTAAKNRLSILALTLGLMTILSCKSPGPASQDSTVKVFNGTSLSPSNELYHQTMKFFYRRDVAGGKTAEFSSTGWLISPNVILTSGHTLEKGSHNFELALEGGKRYRIEVAKTIYSIHEHQRQYLRGAIWAGKGRQQNETWDVGAIVLSGDMLPPWKAIPPSLLPVRPGDPLTLVGTGKNDVNNDWNSVVKIKGDFKAYQSDDMMFTYRMDKPGMAYSGVGDSGGPLIRFGKGVGIHGGNYADPALSVGYGSSLHFQGAKKFFSEIAAAGGKGVGEILTAIDYLQCVRGGKVPKNWVPIAYVQGSQSKVLLLDSIGWLYETAFDQNGIPNRYISDASPWIHSNVSGNQLRFAVFNPSACAMGEGGAIELTQAISFDQIKLNISASDNGYKIQASPRSGKQQTINLYWKK